MPSSPTDTTEYLLFCEPCGIATRHRPARPTWGFLERLIVGEKWHCVRCSTSRGVGGLFGGRP